MNNSETFEYQSYRVKAWWWLACSVLWLYLVPPSFPYRFHVGLAAAAVTALVGYREFAPTWHRGRIYRTLCYWYQTEHIAVKWGQYTAPFITWIKTADDMEANIDRLLPIVYTTTGGERQEEYLRYVSNDRHIKLIAPAMNRGGGEE